MRLLPFDYAIRNLARSPRRLMLVVGGSMLVSLLALGSVAFSRGLERSLSRSGLDGNAFIVGSGSEESAERSELSRGFATVLASSIDGLRTVAGVPAVSAEIHAALPLTARDEPAVLRGFEPEAFLVHPQVRLVEGRWPARGSDEIAVGLGAARRTGDPRIGDTVAIAGEGFTVCGFFDAQGTVMHGEIWMRLDRLAQLMQRSSISCVVAALGEAEFDDIDAFTATRLDLESIAMRESDYYGRLAEFMAPMRTLVAATALLVSIGGVLAGLNAMYAAFAARTREAATLRALGFGRRAIALSLATESTVACLAGALLACLAATLWLDGLAVELSMGSFGLAIDAHAIATGLLSGLLLGILGAIPPILRCLALPIPSALRS